MSELVMNGPVKKDVMLTAINTLANAVKSTMGTSGKTVIIRDTAGNTPLVTKDGATVAKHVFTGDPAVDLIIRLFRTAAIKVEDEVGDGTTTTTVLTQALVNAVTTMTHPPRNLNRWLDSFLQSFKEFITSVTETDLTDEDVLNIARVSTNGDEALSTIIGDTVKAIGAYGSYKVAISGETDRVITSKGYTLNRGLAAEAFCYGTAESFESEGKCNLVVLDRKLSADDMAVIKHYSQEQSSTYTGPYLPLVVFCKGISEEQIDSLIDMADYGSVPVLPIQSTSFDRDAKAQIMDLAAVTGATITLESILSNVQVVNGVTASTKSLTVTPVEGVSSIAYLTELNEMLYNATSAYDVDRLTSRINRMIAGTATILLAGETEAAATEKKDRVDDAILACQAALKHGYVIGGGYVYLDAATALGAYAEGDEELESKGLVMLLTLESVFKTQLYNAGFDELDVDLFISSPNNSLEVYDVGTDAVVSREDFRIIDPALTPIKAMEAAVSMAKLACGSDYIIMGDPNNFTSLL